MKYTGFNEQNGLKNVPSDQNLFISRGATVIATYKTYNIW